MNVLFVTDNPNLGASVRTMLEWIEIGRSVNTRYSVVLKGQGPFDRWLHANDVPRVHDAMPWPDRRRPLEVVRHVGRVAAFALRRRIDVIHAEHNVYPFARLVGRLVGRPVVCHAHFRLEPGFASWAFRGRRRPALLIWTSHQQMRDSADAVHGFVPADRQLVIPLGLRVSRFGARTSARRAFRTHLGLSDDTVVVGMASAFKPIKRVEDFINAVSAVAATGRPVAGLLAGEEIVGEEGYAEQTRTLLALRTSVRWLGHVDPIEDFLHAVDIYVSTSEYESFGMSVCEAMACRRPVVAYKGGSVEEVLGAAGRLLDTGDFEGLVRSLTELVDDVRERGRLGDLARARVASVFDPEASFPLLQAAYERACDDQ